MVYMHPKYTTGYWIKKDYAVFGGVLLLGNERGARHLRALTWPQELLNLLTDATRRSTRVHGWMIDMVNIENTLMSLAVCTGKHCTTVAWVVRKSRQPAEVRHVIDPHPHGGYWNTLKVTFPAAQPLLSGFKTRRRL